MRKIWYWSLKRPILSFFYRKFPFTSYKANLPCIDGLRLMIKNLTSCTMCTHRCQSIVALLQSLDLYWDEARLFCFLWIEMKRFFSWHEKLFSRLILTNKNLLNFLKMDHMAHWFERIASLSSIFESVSNTCESFVSCGNSMEAISSHTNTSSE